MPGEGQRALPDGTLLTSHTADQCSQRLNALMGQYRVGVGAAS